MNIGCVVLAAGQGRRFGENKLLKKLGDQPVLERVLDALPGERFSKLAAVVSSQGAEALCRRKQIPCLYYPGGPQSESIRRGIQAMAELDGCLFVMGDQPLCTRKSIVNILDAFLAHPQAVVRLAWENTPCSPVLFPQKYFSALEGLTGERGGMAALRGLNPEVILVQAQDERELWDIDTRDDLEKMEQALKQHFGD